jgi:hypothetical protein
MHLPTHIKRRVARHKSRFHSCKLTLTYDVQRISVVISNAELLMTNFRTGKKFGFFGAENSISICRADRINQATPSPGNAAPALY